MCNIAGSLSANALQLGQRLPILLRRLFGLPQSQTKIALTATNVRNINPDPELARHWYQRAAQLGSADAQRRLAQMQN